LTSLSTQYISAPSKIPNQQVSSLNNFVKMLAYLSILTFAVTALAAPQAPVLGASATATSTAVGPNPTEVYINSISYGGTGCPQDSVGSFISADRQTSVDAGFALFMEGLTRM
jgi:hypothetical protein